MNWWKSWKTLLKMDDLWGKPTIFGNTHMNFTVKYVKWILLDLMTCLFSPKIRDDLWVQSEHLRNSLSTCCVSCLPNGPKKNATLQTLFRPHAPSCVGPRHGVAIGQCKRYHSMKDWVELREQIHMVDVDMVFSNSSFTEPCNLPRV